MNKYGQNATVYNSNSWNADMNDNLDDNAIKIICACKINNILAF